MTTKLIWRLKEQPTTESLRELVKSGILTNDEAREILFSQEEQSSRDLESYKQEIKFLKEVIEKLGDRTKIIEIVKEYVPHYITQPFYQPYYFYCNGSSITSGATGCSAGAGVTNAMYTGTTGSNLVDCSGGGTVGSGSQTSCSFSSIIS